MEPRVFRASVRNRLLGVFVVSGMLVAVGIGASISNDAWAWLWVFISFAALASLFLWHSSSVQFEVTETAFVRRRGMKRTLRTPWTEMESFDLRLVRLRIRGDFGPSGSRYFGLQGLGTRQIDELRHEFERRVGSERDTNPRPISPTSK